MRLSGENSRLEFDIIIHKKDDVYFQIECERSIAKELNEYFSFDVPGAKFMPCLLYTSPSPRDQRGSRMPSSA